MFPNFFRGTLKGIEVTSELKNLIEKKNVAKILTPPCLIAFAMIVAIVNFQTAL